jgi:hypothetical protein
MKLITVLVDCWHYLLTDVRALKSIEGQIK